MSLLDTIKGMEQRGTSDPALLLLAKETARKLANAEKRLDQLEAAERQRNLPRDTKTIHKAVMDLLEIAEMYHQMQLAEG